MVGNLAKLVKPTGLEDLAQRSKDLRELAKLMDEQSMGSQPVGSWTQVMAKMLAGFVAGKERRQAGKLDEQYRSTLSKNFSDAHEQFLADKAAGMSDEQLFQKYGTNEYAQDDLKPIAESYIEALKTRAAQANTMRQDNAGTWRTGSELLDKPNPDFDKMITVGQDGLPHINMMRIAAARLAGPTGPGFTYNPPGGGSPIGIPAYGGPTPAPGAPPPTGTVPFTAPNIKSVESAGGRDFLPNGQPVRSSAGAMYGMQVLPSTAAKPGYGVPPVSPEIMGLPDTDPRKAAAFDNLGGQYAQAMSSRFGEGGPAAYNAGPGRVGNAMAGGSNWLSQMPRETQVYSSHFSRPPDGVAKNGKPYWMVNGEAYDNPEGQ